MTPVQADTRRALRAVVALAALAIAIACALLATSSAHANDSYNHDMSQDCSTTCCMSMFSAIDVVNRGSEATVESLWTRISFESESAQELQPLRPPGAASRYGPEMLQVFRT